MLPIAQITWVRYTNFGTSLQAYALQQTLFRMGYSTKIIFDDRFTPFTPRYNTLKSLIGIGRHPRSAMRYYKFWRDTIRPFNRFADRYLCLDKKWIDTDDLNSRYSCFICGSDQIWSPLLPHKHGGFYYAAFTNKPKIAYAPSIGVTSLPSSYVSEVQPWIAAFTALSLREQQATQLFNTKMGINAITVLDPTLLLESKEWEKIIKMPTIKGRYILAYFLSYNEEYLNQVHAYAKKRNLIVVTLGNDKRIKNASQIKLKNIGPSEFLGLVHAAEKVVTDSFHGTIFAIQFNKPFATLKRFSDNDDQNQNSRIENLFRLLGIPLFASTSTVIKEGIKTLRLPENWNNRIAGSRQQSIDFLRNSLKQVL